MKKIWNLFIVTIFGILFYIALFVVMLLLVIGTNLMFDSKLKTYLIHLEKEFKEKI